MRATIATKNQKIKSSVPTKYWAVNGCGAMSNEGER